MKYKAIITRTKLFDSKDQAEKWLMKKEANKQSSHNHNEYAYGYSDLYLQDPNKENTCGNCRCGKCPDDPYTDDGGYDLDPNQLPNEPWDPVSLLEGMANGSQAERLAILKKAGIIDANGNLTPKYDTDQTSYDLADAGDNLDDEKAPDTDEEVSSKQTMYNLIERSGIKLSKAELDQFEKDWANDHFDPSDYVHMPEYYDFYNEEDE